jgi:hypothetical protein
MRITIDTLYNINGQILNKTKILSKFAKDKKYKPVKRENGELTVAEFTGLLFESAISTGDVDPEMEEYASDIKELHALLESSKVTRKQAQEILTPAPEPEPEKVDLSIGFSDDINAGAASALGVSQQLFLGIKEAFPESVSIDENCNVTLSESATIADVGKAIGVATQLEQSTQFAGNVMGFVIGDLINAAVAKGIFDNKKACALYISETMASSGQKNISVSAAENLARVSERIAPELRSDKVQQSAYHLIANVKQPKKRDGESDSEFKKREGNYKKGVTKILKEIKETGVAEIKEVKKRVEGLQVSSGSKETPTRTLGDYARLIVEAVMLTGLCGKDGIMLLREGTTEGDSVTLTNAQLKAITASAVAHYSNLKGVSKDKDIHVSNALLEFMEVK